MILSHYRNCEWNSSNLAEMEATKYNSIYLCKFGQNKVQIRHCIYKFECFLIHAFVAFFISWSLQWYLILQWIHETIVSIHINTKTEMLKLCQMVLKQMNSFVSIPYSFCIHTIHHTAPSHSHTVHCGRHLAASQHSQVKCVICCGWRLGTISNWHR